MSRPRLRAVALISVASAVVVLTGCQYRWGSVMHPQISTLAVGAFENATKESSATGLLRGGLAEQISTEPGVSLEQPKRADAIIEGRIINFRQRRLARAEVRDRRVAEDDADQFQTVLYRVEATVEFSVRLPGTEKRLLQTRRIVGQADMSRWPDQDVLRQRAIGNALDDAARQIVAAITEAW